MSRWGKEDSANGLFGHSQAAERVTSTGPLWAELGLQWAGPELLGEGQGCCGRGGAAVGVASAQSAQISKAAPHIEFLEGRKRCS